MKVKDWLWVAGVLAAFVFGALLFRGCNSKQVEVVRWQAVNLDSLKATIVPDTIRVPVEKQVTRITKVPVLLSDTANIDSLLLHFMQQRDYFISLIEQLNTPQHWGWDFGSVELPMQTTVYADSVQTPRYFHKWRIEAEGPIQSYTYGILPICPASKIEAKRPKLHRAGFLIGGQYSGSEMRPIYGAQYQYRFINLNAGYLPKTDTNKGAFQFQVGATIGIK